jgi:ATP-dependent Clp protease ATP-binding subunit ClpB
MGDTSGSMLGRDLEALIERARGHKKEYGDSFISVEHLVLGFVQDKRFGQQLFRDFQLSAKSLNAAIQAIRGSQKVTDQGIPLQILFAVLVSSASRMCKN